jgi:hypothetical protein
MRQERIFALYAKGINTDVIQMMLHPMGTEQGQGIGENICKHQHKHRDMGRDRETMRRDDARQV